MPFTRTGIPLRSIPAGDGQRISEVAYDVECILVIGQFSNIEGNNREHAIKLKTLELYRRNLRNIEILLYDELYERARFIVEGSRD